MKPFFYSQLQRAVSAAPDKVFGKAENVKNWLLANQSKLNIKKDEIIWSGITDWLDTQDRTTKANVLAYLEGNGVQVQDVMLQGVRRVEDIAKPYNYKYEYDDLAEVGCFFDKDGEEVEFDDLPSELKKELNSTVAMPKFESQQLPGGKNYGNLLLTLPVKANKVERPKVIERGHANYDVVNSSDEVLDNFKTWSEAQDTALEIEQDGRIRANLTNPTFSSSHFDSLNIVAHVRYNERTDTNGKRVLFLEEIQSDWGQMGKKQGFNKTPTWEDAAQDAGYNPSEKMLMSSSEIAEIDTHLANMIAGKARLQTSAIPAAPFVTDTKSWTALALKRMISYAVENGFDSIAWTTGEQQADRYDLSKQISEINYGVLETGEYNLEIKGIDGSRLDNVELRRVPESDLDKVVGKDVAAKIIAGDGVAEKDNRKILSGINLKVGSEGMKGYYDAIVPQVANDILKKYGGTIDNLLIDVGNKTITVKAGGEGNQSWTKEFENREKANLYIKTLLEEGIPAKFKKLDKVRFHPQLGFTITTEMRSKIQNEGLPLFSLSQIDEQIPMTVEHIKDEVDRLISKWPSAPEVTIVQSSSEIPFGVPSHADGVLHEGKAYLIADNIGTVAQIQKVLAHECVLHHSLLDMLGEYGFAKLHNGVQSLKASGDKTVIGLSQAVAQQYGPLTPEDETKEIVAKAGERCIDAEGNIKIQYAFMKEAYAGVANFMRDKGFQIPFTNIELQGIISNAGKWIARDRGVEDTVSTGHFIGKVLSISNGRVIQKVGREPGQVVSHDVAKLNTKPVVGQLAEIRYQDGKGHVIERSKAPSMQR